MTSERRNLTQPPEYWAAWLAQARSEGLTLSEWVGECCRANLPVDINSGLPERPAAHRPTKEKP